MEEVRDRRLDELCESLGETRDKQAQLRDDERSDMGAALKHMRSKGLTSYRHAGMELSRVPGEEKLRCRRTSQGATAESAPADDELTASELEDVDVLGDERREAIDEVGAEG